MIDKGDVHPQHFLPVETVEGEQIGGGGRMPSPPPVQTPTRLRTTVKATAKDSGLVREAQARRGQLLQAQLGADGDPFQEAPPVATQSSHVQCASLLFGNSAPSVDDSLFPPVKIKCKL